MFFFLIFSVQVKLDIRSATQQKWFAIAVLLLVLIISPVIVMLVVNATNTIQAFASTLVQRTIELQREKHKGDTLLHQMLPRSVVRHLKQHRQVISDLDVDHTELNPSPFIPRYQQRLTRTSRSTSATLWVSRKFRLKALPWRWWQCWTPSTTCLTIARKGTTSTK